MTTTATTAVVPPDDALLTQIIARRRRRTPLVTLALAAAVTAGVAFFGGVEIQKHYGTASTASSGNSSFATLASRFAAGRGGAATGGARTGTGGASFFGGGTGGAVIGTVTLIKGNDIYVTDSSGTTTIVHAGAATVTKSVSGSVKSINPGDTVTVVGAAGSNGSTTARSITVGGGNG